LYGGARGGGKTDCGMAWLLRATEHPEARMLVIRRNADDLADWVDRAHKMYPYAKVTGKPATIRFPSGAIIRCGHLKDESAYTKYQGHEYQRILIEELTQIPSEESYLKLISSCRSTIKGLPPKVFCTANPGGKGHQWVKRRFIQGHKPEVAFKDKSSRYRMYIPATIDNNPTLMDNDPDYVNFLDNLPEPLRSAWRHGDWDIFAGQYFTEWNPKMHIIPETLANKFGYGKEYNKKYIGIDWGFAAPFACIWIEVTPDNRVFCYRELYGTEKHPTEWGQEIMNMTGDEEIFMSLGDPSMWARNPMSWNASHTPMHTDKSIATALAEYVPNLVPANNSRVIGWRNMAQLMHHKKGLLPNFFIIDGTCPNLTRTIPEMIRDDKNPEDIDTTLEDHISDAVRYSLTHIQAPAKPAPKKPMQQQQIEALYEYEDNDDTIDFRSMN
jgi:phage terminase large subunit